MDCMLYVNEAWQRALCLFLLFFFLKAVVYVVAFGGLHFLVKVGDTVVYKYVVPLQQLLDVAVVYAVPVEIGQHLGKGKCFSLGAEYF